MEQPVLFEVSEDEPDVYEEAKIRRRTLQLPGPVTIIRSGYATRALYLEAIAQARHHKRDVRTIDDPREALDPNEGW